MFSRVRMYNFENSLSLHPVFPEVENTAPGQGGDFSIPRPGDPSVAAAFSSSGLLKAVQIGNKPTLPVHLDFIK